MNAYFMKVVPYKFCMALSLQECMQNVSTEVSTGTIASIQHFDLINDLLLHTATAIERCWFAKSFGTLCNRNTEDQFIAYSKLADIIIISRNYFQKVP